MNSFTKVSNNFNSQMSFSPLREMKKTKQKSQLPTMGHHIWKRARKPTHKIAREKSARETSWHRPRTVAIFQF